MSAGSQDTNAIAQFLKAAHPSTQSSMEEIAASKDLYADGWLDSLLTLRLLGFVEELTGVRVPPFQVTRQHFSSVAAITALLERVRVERK